MQHKILLVLKDSDVRTTGYYQMNRYIIGSKLIEDSFTIKIIRLVSNSENRIVSVLKLCQYSIKLFFSIARFRPEIIYFTISPFKAFYRDLVYVVIFKLFKCKILYHLHGKGIKKYSTKNKFKRTLYKWVYKNTYVITVSNLLTYDLQGLQLRKVFVVPNAIEATKKSILEGNPTSRNYSVPKLLFLSNLIRSKGIFDFLDMLKQLDKSENQFHANIVGAEIDLSIQEVISYIKGLESKVTVHGPLYETKKYSIIENSDILVFPTHEDIWGIVILEAMQYGLPVVASHEGAIPEIIDEGVTGFIVEKGNIQELTDKVNLLMQNPQLRQSFGAAAQKKFYNLYTLNIFEQNIVKVFEQILNES